MTTAKEEESSTSNATATSEGSFGRWEARWSRGDTPWDAGQSAPALHDLLHELAPQPQSVAGRRALITGCGRGHDVFTVAKAGFDATGVDVAPSVRPHFEALRAQLPPAIAERSSLLTLDFFDAHPNHLAAPYDFIWDYTFYCAIEPAWRDRWRDKMSQLLAPTGILATLLFPVSGADPDEGPPYPLNPAEVTTRLAPRFERIRLTKVSQSLPGRTGKEQLALWKRRPHESGRAPEVRTGMEGS